MPGDIPFAIRTSSKDKSKQRTVNYKGLGLAFMTACLVLLAYWILYSNRNNFPLQILGRMAPEVPVDGRLLGHFPYPEAEQKTLVPIAPGLLLKPDAASSLIQMQRAAAAEGVSITVISAFRPVTVQKQLFFEVKADRNQSAIERAHVSAPPGFSEHSTGYAVDLGDLSEPSTHLNQEFIHTKAYQWLSNHASRYQFVLSFPDKNLQGVSFEPWHWRFEGSTDALKVFEPANRLVLRAKPRDLQQSP